MKSRLLVAAIGIPLVIAMLILPPIAITIMVSAISVMAVHELFNAVGAYSCDDGARSIKSYGAVIVCSLSALGYQLAAFYKAGTIFYTCWTFTVLIILFALWVAYHERGALFGFVHFSVALMSGLVIPLCLSSLVILRNDNNGIFYAMVPFGTAFIGDAGALFAGMVFGKNKLVPKTSPKKTVEGFMGAIASSVLFMLVFGLIIKNVFDISVGFTGMTIIGVACGILAQLGDLAFSLIKREFGIKDYGALLPGHGGVLDRFDSMVTVAPAALIMLRLFKPF